MDYSEKDIEDFIVNKSMLMEELGYYTLAKQYRTSYGIIDILAYDDCENNIVVVEIKKGQVDENAVGQLMRYMACMHDLVKFFKELSTEGVPICFKKVENIKGVLIGSSCSDAVKTIARSFPFISFVSHSVEINVSLCSHDYKRTEESLLSDYKIAKEVLLGKIEEYQLSYEKSMRDLEEYEKSRENFSGDNL